MSNVRKGVKVPEGLMKLGKDLWVETNDAYILSLHEKDILLQACRTLDLTETLRRRIARDGIMSEGYKGPPVAHPLLNEIRQQRALFGQLIARLDLPDLDSSAGGLVAVPEVNQQRSAVQSRWGKAYG